MRARYRVLTVCTAAGVAVAGLAAPALAHVEVTADKTTAGATDVTLSFHGEAENDAAGITSERVVLPKGVDPASVTLVKAPAGWTFTPAADGFTVGGKALPVGRDAEWKVRIAKLPDGQTRLSFKTIETYGNGDVSRWIEVQEPGQAEPENPAPLITLKPGPAASTAASPSPAASSLAAGTPAASPSAAPATSAAAPATTDGSVAASAEQGSSWWIWLIVAVLVAAALVAVLVRRGNRTT